MPDPVPAAPQRIAPSSGFGQFLASLNNDTLSVTLPVTFVFVPGNQDTVPGLPTDQYQWTSTANADFADRFKRRVQEGWSRRFDIESIDGKRRIEIDVEVVEVALEDALWRVFVSHYPLDAIDTEASVCGAGASHFRGGCIGNPTGQGWGSVLLARTHLIPELVQTREIDPIDVLFPRGDAAPTTNSWINRAVAWLPRGLDWRVRLDGYSDLNEISTDGTESFEQQQQLALQLARDRIAHLEDALVQAGVDRDRIRGVAHGDPGDDSLRQRVDLTVSVGERQDTLVHEAGHMLGLGDEAVTGSTVAGDPLPSPDYSALVSWYTRTLIRRHDDEGIMSRGSTVRFWHYVPFLETLEILTGSTDWRIVPRPGEQAEPRLAEYTQMSSARRLRPPKIV